MTAQKYYTSKEICGMLRITQRTFYNYITAGKLKASKVGAKWIVAESDLEAFIAGGTNEKGEEQ